MEAIKMKLETRHRNVVDVVKNDITLFQKAEIKNRFQVYNFNEDEIVNKLELLMNKFDEIFRA